MFEGRFFLGAGTGERLNEHILSDAWPSDIRRQAMLEEAIGLIRLLWRGGTHTFEGRFFTVDRARIYSLPPDPQPIYLAAMGRRAAQLAGRIGDGLISISPSADVRPSTSRAVPASRATVSCSCAAPRPGSGRSRR